MTEPRTIYSATRLLPLVALLLIVAMQNASAQGPPGQTTPAQVRDVNNPPRLANLVFGLANDLGFNEGNNQVVDTFDFGTLPAGKMLVIESITAQGSAGAGNGILLTLFSFNDASAKQTYIGMTPVGTYTNSAGDIGDTILAASQSLRLYANTNDPALRVNATQVGNMDNIRGNVVVTVQGYLIDP